jgi:multiple sugar transport system substrate-binding protein
MSSTSQHAASRRRNQTGDRGVYSSRRRFIRDGLRLSGLGLLTGCLPAPSPPVSSGRAGGTRAERQAAPITQPTTVTWSFWGDPWQIEVHRRVAAAFEAENSSIKVELWHKPWAEYFTWLEDQWRQGTSPDVMFLNYIPSRAPSGEIEPLDDYFQRDPLDLSDFYPRLLEQFQSRGIYYGLPRDNDTKVIYYNKTLFNEAGLQPPANGWTWSDLRYLAQELTRRDANERTFQYGFAFEAETWWLLFVWQNGGDLVDHPYHPTRVRLGEPAAIDAVQFLADLIHVDRSTPPTDVLLKPEEYKNLFREGRLAMALGNHALVPAFAERAGLRWDVAPLPVGRERANMAGGAGYTISARSSKKEAAWALLRFLGGQKGQALFAESGVVVPARRSIREDSIFLKQQPYGVGVWADETEHGRPPLNAPVREAVIRIVEPALATVWRGERSAADAIQSVLPELRRLVES